MQTHLDTTNITKTQLTGLLTILEEVPDPRVTATVDHDLPDILTIALCTILCGGAFPELGLRVSVVPSLLSVFWLLFMCASLVGIPPKVTIKPTQTQGA